MTLLHIIFIIIIWVLYQGFCQLLSMRMNKITFSDDYFLLIINIILLLFMWILWNKSACKQLYTLLSWFILIFDMIFNEHSIVWWFHFTFKLRFFFFKLNLLTLIENSIKDFANSSLSEWMKLTFQMITIFNK